jgi:hypothetical protein
MPDETMQEEAAIAHCEHDLPSTDVFERAACDLDHVAWPESGQHALPINLQPNGPTQAAATQRLRHQSRAFRAPIRARRSHDIFWHQEVFCENWQLPTVEAILPQDRACVSKTCSQRNAGVW